MKKLHFSFIKLMLIFLVSTSLSASDYKLIGSYLLEYSIFNIDIYVISYLKSDSDEKLVLDYQRDIEKKHSIEGWKVGLKHRLEEQSLKLKIQWFYDHTVDVVKGDKLILKKGRDYLEIYKNNDLIGRSQDKDIIEMAFEPWLGDKPVKKELKAALLKNINEK